MSSLTAALKPSHRYLTSPLGHELRLTYWHPQATGRTVYRRIGAALVELGTVRMVTGTVGFASPVDEAPVRGMRCSSYADGAFSLDRAIDVLEQTSYVLTAAHWADADATEGDR